MDNDPDFVSDPVNVPATSKGKAFAKPTATNGAKNIVASLPGSHPLPGGRSKAPIWAYYIADDKKINGHLDKGPICQVKDGGSICGK